MWLGAQLVSPLVTCICVTRNRREWLPKAIRHFQAQTYSNRELLILADGESVADLVPADESIHLIQAAMDNPEPINIGDKRNAAVAMSQGDVIAHWDDD